MIGASCVDPLDRIPDFTVWIDLRCEVCYYRYDLMFFVIL